MKVHLVGNVANVAYVLAKFLRKHGVNAHLWISAEVATLDRPEVEDPELRDGYPNWIKVLRLPRWRYRMIPGMLHSILKELGDCDIIHTQGVFEPILGMRTGRPHIYHRTGAAFEVTPFRSDGFSYRVIGYFLRKALRQADKIIAITPIEEPFQSAIQRLQLGACKIAYLPVPIDADKYRPLAEEERKQLKSQYGAELLFFHPTRQFWSSKGNDLLLRAFSRFARTTKKRVVMLCSNRGPDVEQSCRLVRDLGIEGNIVWLDYIPRQELVSYYNAADVVFDQFIKGEFGNISLEAWACGRPVFVRLHDHSSWYTENPPGISVASEQGIFERLTELTEGGNNLAEIGRRSREWVSKYCHGDSVALQYISLYRQILGRARSPGSER